MFESTPKIVSTMMVIQNDGHLLLDHNRVGHFNWVRFLDVDRVGFGNWNRVFYWIGNLVRNLDRIRNRFVYRIRNRFVNRYWVRLGYFNWVGLWYRNLVRNLDWVGHVLRYCVWYRVWYRVWYLKREGKKR